MSSETDKFAERRQEALKRKKELRKMQESKIKPSTRKKLIGVLVGVAVLIVAAAIVFASANFPRRMVNAMTVGEKQVSSAEFNYYYTQAAVSTYNSYLSYFGGSYVPFDPTVKLSKQQYSETQTWEDYFVDYAATNVQQIKTLVQAAEKEGMTLSEEGKIGVETTMTSLASYAANAGKSLDRYLSEYYGRGLNAELVRQILTEQSLAGEYDNKLYESPAYTDGALEQYYQTEGHESYTYVDIRYYSFNKADATDTTPAMTLEEAKAAAEAVAGKAESEEAFSTALTDILKERAADPETVTDTSLHQNYTKASLNVVEPALAEWAFNADTKPGDVTTMSKADGTGYIAAYLVASPYRNEYNTVDLREIYIEADDPESEESMKEADARAQQLMAEWVEGDATEESFAALADRESAASLPGGLIEKVAKSNDDMSNWAFSDERVAGDVGVYPGLSGYYILYYKGQNEPYWKVQVEAALRSKDYDEAYTKLTEQYPVTRSGFGIGLRDEPFV